MKLDMANFAVNSIRPHLVQQSVEYERSKFQEFLEKQPSNSLFDVLFFVGLIFKVECFINIFSKRKKKEKKWGGLLKAGPTSTWSS